ncbi:MAG: ferrous iron transporter B [Abditibacteriales bacterium]|nr:ferrous iron transporter B [Abditibacteriales bacterium]MDW8364441.1 nucleoside recognition domain-containing protein [Abditibacteriales bacterium]
MTHSTASTNPQIRNLIERAQRWRAQIGDTLHDRVVSAVFADAAAIAQRTVKRSGKPRSDWERRIDSLLTSRLWGFPIMLALLTVVFWVTIQGANVPSEMIATALFWLQDQLEALFNLLHAPWWLTGFLVHGVYRGLAWVVSVMLPPMAIFFPCFTLLEDLGYLPRVAFNMDRLFKRVGAHGKQALTMSMGFGCNAAGVIACRIIDSPRERLIAILTNNFVPCNGRWPTLILMATMFVGAAFPAHLASIAAASSLVAVTLFGICMTLLVSAFLSRTVLKGVASSFALELPPYRPPQVLRVLYTSIIDRTLLVLWRAVVMAAPCGGLAWILGNVHIGSASLMQHLASFLNPVGHAIGLDGVILLAYIVAIPANEIVVPTILMAYLNAGMMTEIDSMTELKNLLVNEHGWTLLTAVCLMLFSLLHNPCSTTLITIYQETKSKKWTAVAALLPLAIAFAVCFIVAQTARLLGWA